MKNRHVASLLALSLLTGKALAQTTASDATLPPVVVRGERVESTYRPAEAATGVLGDLAPLSTPFSVNSLTRDLIVNQQASYLGDFLKNDPSAVIGNVVISFATLRGFSLGSSGFLVDGLQLGSVVLDGRVSLDAFERVDVLKGASAFLTGLGGTSSLGGVINYVPKTALGAPVRDVYLQYGASSQLGVGVDLGDRFGADGAFGLRINASTRDGETSVDEMRWRQNALSLNGDWRVGSDLSLQMGLYHVDNDFDRMLPFFIGVSDGNDPIPIPKAPDADRNFTPAWNTFNQRSDIGWLRADWAFAPDWRLTVQYGTGDNERPYGNDMDTRFGTIGPGGSTTLFASQESSRVKAQSGQALVHGKFATGAVRHELTFGVSASQEKNYGSFAVAGVAPGSLYEPNTTPQPALFSPFEVLPYTGKTKGSGLILSDILHFDERWSLLLGGRQAKLDSFGADGVKDEGGSISKFAPTLAVMFKPTPASLVYANFAQGLEPGGTAPAGTDNVGQIMPAQVTKQYEIGAKLELGGTMLTAALFDMRRPLQSRNADNDWAQEGDQIHRGLELMASGAVTRDLRLVAGTMFLDTEQHHTNDPSSEGKRVAGVPRWTANAWADYRLAAVPGLFLNAGLYYTALQYFDNANLQAIPSWTRLDIGARYETKAGGYPLALLFVVENATNRSYWQSALGNALTIGDPLTVKATARMSF